MLKKLTGIFILLSFLLIKSSPLFAMVHCKHDLTVCCAEQGGDENPDAEKESQQLEITDEDFIQQSIKIPGFLLLTKKAILFNDARINTPYISLPYPPPNGR